MCKMSFEVVIKRNLKYKNSINKWKKKTTTVSEHFLTNDHSANDIILIPIELTKSNRDSVRKAREAYLV